MYSTIQGNLYVLAFVLQLQMQSNSFLGASTNIGFQNNQQWLKSLNLSGTDMSKVMTLAPLPPFTNIGITHGSMFQLDPKLLAAGIVELKEITLTYTCLTL